MGHLALADKCAQIVVVGFDPRVGAVLNGAVILGRIAHPAGSEEGDLLAA